MPSEGATAPARSASGTPIDRQDIVTSNSQNTSLTHSSEQHTLPQDGEEQALESHEVIELQTFSERKAWIEEKIKFLGKMPPIEVFVGLDSIRSSAEEVPGLPTRAELQQWVVEHDRIEKETEIFDSGELKKLKKFTKAATQRNLSPEDTDLIELTLTTIYELDKLLHLLRDRSENLDLLGTRLTWEEHRIAGWSDRRKIISDLQSFLETRARWSPSVYETVPKPEETPTRRGSVASLASMASMTSDSSVSSPGFSRSVRFKLAELLSRDAAQFGARVTALRHGKISGAGKALDKLIDNSRKPVPEELLDEQDRLEDRGINELENVGKFVMSVVMQWRKADEIYVETMKDQTAAQNLMEEIETAKLHHPTTRQSASYVSRADALVKRLSLRGNPASSISSFPRPVHSLFPDQKASNDALAESLSSEISAAVELAKNVDAVAKEYWTTSEAVRTVETLTQSANDVIARFITLTGRLEGGVTVSDGDGAPPNLTSELCLEVTRHSSFLALLPSILEELGKTDESADLLLRGSRALLLGLDRPGVDPSFKVEATSIIQELSAQRDRACKVKEDVLGRVNRLREARKIWAGMEEGLLELEDIRREIGDAMERQRWRQQTGRGTTPLTPESPLAVLPSNISPTDAIEHLDEMQIRLSQNVGLPLSSLSTTLEKPLHEWLAQSWMGLKSLMDSVKQMDRLLDAIRGQATVMSTIREEVHDLQFEVEDLKIRLSSGMENILGYQVPSGEPEEVEVELISDVKKVGATVQAFSDSLSQRVPFVSRRHARTHSDANFVRRRFSSGNLKLGAPQLAIAIELPFDLASLDDAVRTDSNSYAMTLSSDLQSLNQKGDYLRLARMAKDVDFALSHTVDDIECMAQELLTFKTSFATLSERSVQIVPLQALSRQVDDYLQQQRTQIGHSFSPIRDLLCRMDTAPGAHDPAVHETIVVARLRAVDDAESKLAVRIEGMESLKGQILEVQQAEAERLEKERIAEEQRLQAEKERQEHERLERERLEQKRLQMEQGRVQQERVEKERLEKEKLEMERLEKERLVKERLEMERLEMERLEMEMERLEKERFEMERLEMERLEKERLEKERLEKENERLEMERLEKERLEKERLEKEMLEKERFEQERLEMEHLEKERQILQRQQWEQEKLQQERLEKDRSERERKETETIEKGRVGKARQLDLEQMEREHVKAQATEKTGLQLESDVFGLRVAPSSPSQVPSQKATDLQARIICLRKRLRSININEVARPSSSSSSSLPTRERWKRMEEEFSQLSADVTSLPTSTDSLSVNAELQSLRADVELSAELMQRVRRLADLSEAVHSCDLSLSDLLEHIDSYPAPPLGPLSSPHVTQTNQPPEEQLSCRLSFTKTAVSQMSSHFTAVPEDSRAIAERKRILQTWCELEEMGNDRINGKKSRPASVVSSGRNSSTSIVSSHSSGNKKRGAYHNLSVGSSNRGKFLTPSHPTPRRVLSGSADPPSRSSSRMSKSSNRSVSGPMFSPSSTLYGSTFASRQRTASLTSNSSSAVPLARKVPGTPSRPRPQAGQSIRSSSPTVSETSSLSRSTLNPSRSSASVSSWARAPRQSFPTLPRVSTPPKRPAVLKKTYVANPRNKLDMAVGDVVNKLPVNINVEVLPETWKDQSGKYWIGDQDPKLCFCRILRSQTVMVRVGGGWTELSKFIKDHFADLFRLIPDSPPRPGAREERWISSVTLLEAPEIAEQLLVPPRTPEPKGPFVPSFSLSTPSGQSPRSLKSTPSSGSPLTPLQFIRRADEVPGLRPATPSKSPLLRPRASVPPTPARNSVWRP